MKIAGLDPGLSGAIAIYDTELRSITSMWDIPTLQVKRGKTFKRQLDLSSLDDIFSYDFPARVAFIEDVGGIPGHSVAGAFNFGKSVGVLDTFVYLHGISCTRVAAATWKKTLKVTAEKDGARFRASQLMPKSARLWPRKKDHDRAEAALIAYYGALQMISHEVRRAA